MEDKIRLEDIISEMQQALNKCYERDKIRIWFTFRDYDLVLFGEKNDIGFKKSYNYDLFMNRHASWEDLLNDFTKSFERAPRFLGRR